MVQLQQIARQVGQLGLSTGAATMYIVVGLGVIMAIVGAQKMGSSSDNDEQKIAPNVLIGAGVFMVGLGFVTTRRLTLFLSWLPTGFTRGEHVDMGADQEPPLGS